LEGKKTPLDVIRSDDVDAQQRLFILAQNSVNRLLL